MEHHLNIEHFIILLLHCGLWLESSREYPVCCSVYENIKQNMEFNTRSTDTRLHKLTAAFIINESVYNAVRKYLDRDYVCLGSVLQHIEGGGAAS